MHSQACNFCWHTDALALRAVCARPSLGAGELALRRLASKQRSMTSFNE